MDIFFLIIPRITVLIGGRIIDVPSVDEIAAKKSRYRQQLWTEDMKKINQFDGPKTEDFDLLINSFQKFMANLADERNKKITAFNQRLNENRHNKLIDQEKLAFNLARLSPASIFSLAVTNLAGTSINMKQSFLKSANDYQQIYAQFLREKLDSGLPESGIIVRNVGDEESEPINPMELPIYNFNESKSDDILNRTIIDFSLLVILNLIFFSASVYSFLKFDVR